jgi:hypothetical protein
VENVRVEITKDGKLVIITGTAAEPAQAEMNEWD